MFRALRFRFVTGLVLVLFACHGCGPGNQSSDRPQDLIIGNWTWTGNYHGKVTTIRNEFRKDGVVKVVQDGIPFEANYKFVDENQIDYGVYGRSKIVSITNEKMIIICNDGVRRTWTRS